jgi:phosphatidylserine decarboxylase
MAGYPHPIIAREGWVHCAIAIAAALVATLFIGWISIPFWLLVLFVLQFFRDPTRNIPSDPGTVVSPADGRVVSVERASDAYLNREALKISVFMNVFNVHANRSPVTGEIVEAWYYHGRFFNAALDKASMENERNALWIKTEDEIDVTCVQIAGLIARRIFCYVKPGDKLQRGQRYGFIRFGSRVDVYLPATVSPLVSVGDKVFAGETILATLTDTK